MTKLLIITFIGLIFFSAKAEAESGIMFKGGPNVATLAHDSRVNRYGFSGGLVGHLQWSLSDRFSLAGQIELLYTSRGAEVIFQGISQGKIRQHYFDTMIAARPEVWFGRISGYLLLGGGLNFLARANDENAAGVPRDVTNDLRRIDVSLLAGAGVALHLPSGGIGPFRFGAVFLEARHDRGLIDIDTNNGGFKNRTSSLMLGLSFTVGTPPPVTASSPVE